VTEAGLGQLRRPRLAGSGAALWVARVAAGAAAFVAGGALGRSETPGRLAIAALLGALAVAWSITHGRWCLVGALFLLVAYAPDVVAAPSAAHAVIAIVLAGIAVRWASGRERVSPPEEMLPFAALALAYVAATLLATDRRVAAAETQDLISYAAVVAALLVLLDTPAWLRRAAWAIVAGIGLLAVLAILQQLTRTYPTAYHGFASVLPAGDAMRSAGPLNPNPFGQVLATAAVLALYLARVGPRFGSRVLAVAIAAACIVALAYTQSRAALIALVLVAIGIGVLRGVRLRVLAVAIFTAVVVGTAVLPASLQTRVGDLYGAVSANAGTPQDSSLRGRRSENLAALRMWADHPLIGVGPDNFEIHYEQYSEAIGTDPRPEERGAHNLYLESLAETGVLGAAAFLTIVGLAVRGAWRARRRLDGADVLVAEGVFAALATFLICAFTLHSAYARYEWIFLGLGLAAGRLARRAAP
jgi:O-antigen ligase